MYFGYGVPVFSDKEAERRIASPDLLFGSRIEPKTFIYVIQTVPIRAEVLWFAFASDATSSVFYSNASADEAIGRLISARRKTFGPVEIVHVGKAE